MIVDDAYDAGSDMDERTERATTGRAGRGTHGRAGAVLVLGAMLASAFAVIVLSQSIAPQEAAAGATRAKVKYCTRHRHPRGCITVPNSAIRPRKINEQGSQTLTPAGVENGGGLGGGPGNHRDTALAWALTQRNLKRWAWRCECFVEEAYGTRMIFTTAAAAASRLALHHDAVKLAPPGSLVYFAADKYNQRYGHVGLSLGHGRMISALSRVAVTDVTHSKYWRKLYLGWVDAPTTWPGRIPPPPGATTTDAEAVIRLTAPAPGQTVSGTVALTATATGIHGVVFNAYYATDPLNADTRGWHEIGAATPHGDIWTRDWDTASVRDQGFGPWGTVNIAATVLDAAGQRTGTRDYRRLSIDNSTGSKQPDAHVFSVHNTCRDGNCGLIIRETPSTTATQLGVLYDGATANIRCQTVGTLVTGMEGSNDVWDQIDLGGGSGYVADLYMDTPGGEVPQPHRHFSPAIPKC